MSDLLSRLESLKATERKAMAIAAYDDACEHPDCTDWQTIAHALRRVLPNVRKVSTQDMPGEIGDGFAPWFELKKRPSNGSGKDYGSVRAEITFADGRVIRSYALTFKGSAPNIAGACRTACELWRYKANAPGREWFVDVPEIIAVCIPDLGAEYDPAMANAYTAEIRQAEAEPAPTLESIKRAHASRLQWIMDPDSYLPIYSHGVIHERLEYVWPPISETEPEPAPIAEPLPEAIPEPVATPDAPAAPVAAQSALVRRLLGSALSVPMPAAAIKPLHMLGRPLSVPMARAA